MCEYCNEDEKRTNIDDNGEIKIYIDKEMGNNLCIEYYHYGTKTNRYIPIVFCPMCNRIINKELLEKLKEKVQLKPVGVGAAQQAFQPLTPDTSMTDIQKEINEEITKQLAVDPLKLLDKENISGLMRGAMM